MYNKNNINNINIINDIDKMQGTYKYELKSDY